MVRQEGLLLPDTLHGIEEKRVHGSCHADFGQREG